MHIHNPADLLPQKPPMLMLDAIVDIEPGQQGVGVRMFREGDACFEGHFPGNPILPGVLIIEAMAQTALAVLATSADKPDNYKPMGYLAKIQDSGFYRAITPNMEIRFLIQVKRQVKQFVMVESQALHHGERCAKASLTLSMEDTSNQ